MTDEWEQYAVSDNTGDEWEKYSAKPIATKQKQPASMQDFFKTALANATPFGAIRPATRAAGIMAEDISKIVPEVKQTIMEGAAPAAKQLVNDPARFGENVAGGVLGLARGAINAPHDLTSYLGHLELIDPKLAEQVSSIIPKVPEIEPALNLMIKDNPTAADKLIRNIVQVVPLGKPAIGMVMKNAPAIVSKAGNIAKNTDELISRIDTLPTNIINRFSGKNTSEEMSLSDLKGKTLEEAQKEYAAKFETESEKLKKLQYESKANINAKMPESLEYKRNTAQSKLERLNQMASSPEVPPEQIAQAKKEYDIAEDDYNIAKANAQGEIGTSSPYAIQNRLETSREKLNMLRNNLEKNPPTTEEELLAAQQEVYRAISEHESASNASHERFGTSNPNSIQYKLNLNEDKIFEINNALKEHKQTEFPDLEKTSQTVKMAEKSHADSVKLNENINKNIGKLLNEDIVHDVENARIVKKKLEANRKELSEEYDAINEDLAEENVVISNTEEIKKLTSDLNKLVQEDRGLEKNANQIEEIGKKILSKKNREIIPANDFISMYKSVNGYMRNAFKKAYEVGVNEEQRVTWKKRGEEAKTKLDEMDRIIEKNLGKEMADRIKAIGSRWKKEIIPLYNEPLYWQIMDKERMSSTNMMSQVRGGTKGSGLEIIRNILESDPITLKNLIGQRYAASPKNLYSPKGLMKSYIEKLPELKTMLGEKVEADAMISKTKQNIAEAKLNHEQAEKQHNQAEIDKIEKEKKEKELEKRQKKQNLMEKFKQEIEVKKAKKESAIEKQKQVEAQHKASKPALDQLAAFEKEIPAMEKHLDIIKQSEITKLKAKEAYATIKERKADADKVKKKLLNNKADLEKTIKLANEYIPKLKEALKNTELSAEDVKKINDALQKAKTMKEQSNRKLLYVLSGLASISGVSKLFNLGKVLIGGG